MPLEAPRSATWGRSLQTIWPMQHQGTRLVTWWVLRGWSRIESRLAGRPDSRLEIVDRRGHVLQTMGGKKGHPGHNVKTTLDMNVQAAAEAGYGGATGGAVVIDPGREICWQWCQPFHRPEQLRGGHGAAAVQPRPLGLYPPGSSMKVVTASAAKRHGHGGNSAVGPEGVQRCPQLRIRELQDADVRSSHRVQRQHPWFAEVALRLGARRLHHYAGLFGFNRPPSLPVGAATSSFPMPQDESDLMWGAVGQAQDLASPLQMASVAATVADLAAPGWSLASPLVLHPEVGE